MLNVIIKLKHTNNPNEIIKEWIKELSTENFIYDVEYGWIEKPFKTVELLNSENELYMEEQEGHLLIRGKLSTQHWKALKEKEYVVNIYRDSLISPTSTCPSRSPGSPNDLRTIREELKIPQLWQKGLLGKDIYIGVIDSGINNTSTDSRFPDFPLLKDGFPYDYGTKSLWNNHGDMVAYDILTMAPRVKLLDIRIAEYLNESRLSDVVKAYQWTMHYYNTKGYPHILNNSWALYNHFSDLAYAFGTKDKNGGGKHPIIEWIELLSTLGMSIVFAAGNCGCPTDSRCGRSYGYDNSIWGANSHPNVITVGSVTYTSPGNYDITSYSSLGKGALFANKPDLVCYSNIKLRGYTHRGTSVSAPFVSGILALLYQKNPSIKPLHLKKLILENCSSPTHSYTYGYGLITPSLVEPLL